MTQALKLKGISTYSYSLSIKKDDLSNQAIDYFNDKADSSGKCNSIKTSHNITGCIPAQCLSRTII